MNRKKIENKFQPAIVVFYKWGFEFQFERKKIKIYSTLNERHNFIHN